MEKIHIQQVEELKMLAITNGWQSLLNRFSKGEEASDIKELNFYKKSIKVIPICFKCLTSLKVLQLWSNHITKLVIIPNPSAMNFYSFQFLKQLYLNDNLIETVQGILHIQILNLTVLRLGCNKISNFRALRRVHLPQILQFKINKNKTDQHNFFNELKSKRLQIFFFGECDLFGNKDQFRDKSSMLIFKMESQFYFEKQRIWEQNQKRTANIIQQIIQSQDNDEN